MNEAERQNIAADVLEHVGKAMLRLGYEMSGQEMVNESEKLRVPEQPQPPPEPEIPFGPGDVFETKGNGTGTQWIAVCWDGDDMCGRHTDYKPGLYHFDLDLLVRVKIAEIKSGDPVEVVAGPYAGKWGRVEDVDKLTQSCRLDLALFQARVPRHEIRKLRA